MAVIRFCSMVTLTAVFQHFGHTLSVENKKIHHQMSSEELRNVFHVDRHELVPEYEVVMVHAATPYMSYQEDNIGPPKTSPSILKKKDLTPKSSENKVKISDIWSVLSELSKKKGNPDWEQSRRRPDNVDEIEETDEHDRVMKLSAFGKDLELKLKKTSGLYGKGIRMWETHGNSSNAHGIEYRELPQEKEEIGELYQDEKNQAALLVHSDKDGGLLVEGTIGHDLVVKPVPSSVRHLVTPPDDEMFLDANDEDIQNDVTMDTGKKIKDSEKKRKRRRRDAQDFYHTHIVFRRKRTKEEDDFSDYALMEPDDMVKKYRKKRGISKREAPYVIFPEILVIVDYDGYRLHGGDNVQIKRYFVSFWNGVDLRYKLLKGPKIRISIAGIIISRGRDATPYLERNRVGRDAIDSAAALTDMGKYLFRERRLPVYDIAVAVTKLDMCRRQFANDACNRGTAGFAYVGGACVVNKRLEKVNSVAIIEDTGGFSGIIVAAHEVGHLLGAVHDGSPPPSYLGGPGAEKCRWEDGFIMSDLRHTEKGFKWSSCSVASFHHFLNGDTATCLFNSPHEDESLPRVLPGKLLSLDAQCRKDRGTSACFKDDRVCSQLFCFDAGSGYCVAYRPAAEGSPCGDGQYCINGRCVAEHENIIPDYSQNTPSYIRRDDSENLATQSRPVYAFPNSTTQRAFSNEIRTQNPNKSYNPNKFTTSKSPTTKFDYDKYFSNFYKRTTESAHKIFNEFFRTSTQPTTKRTESPAEKIYREFYATSTQKPTTTTESPDVIAYREFYRTSTTTTSTTTTTTTTTESPDVIAYREFYRTSTTESPDVKAYNEFYRTSTTSAPGVRYSTKHPYDISHLFYRSTTKNPYDFSDFDPRNRNRHVDNNSLGSEIRRRFNANNGR